MIMPVNTTSPYNTTHMPTSVATSQTGLTVGLTLFFLVLATVAAVMAYMFKVKSKILSLKRGRGTQARQDYCETPQSDPHQYAPTVIEQMAAPSPVYENLGAHKPAFDTPAVSSRRSDFTNEEDLYLQCDPIYSNDPECSLVIHSQPQDEDVYVIPQS
ncbi:uncharacterized protein ACB058_016002 [Synchiropus picturatus]